jgi:hypothetical protein
VKVAERSGNRWNDVRLAAFAACAPTSGPFDPFLAGAARGLARIEGAFRPRVTFAETGARTRD